MTRSYYDYSPPRRFGVRRSWRPATRAMVIGTIALAALELFLWNVGRQAASSWWERQVFLTPRLAVEDGRFWQFATYMLVQPAGGVFALVSTVLILYFFGSDLEGHLGWKRFVVFYAACGIGGGLAALLWYDRTVAGAGAAVLGVAAACALVWPNRPIQIFVAVRTKWVVLILVGVPALVEAAKAAAKGGVPRVHELGGPMVALGVWALTRFAVQPAETTGVQTTESLERRVDRILQKVHARGIGSLSRRERRILEQASTELRRRSGRSRQPRGE